MDALSGKSAERESALAGEPAVDAARRALAGDLAACRAATLALFARVDPALFRVQVHAGFSPLGWHFGHIAYTEALWLLDGGAAVTGPELARAFAVDGLSKAERVGIPEPAETLDYVRRVRQAILLRLADPGYRIDEAMWRFVLQHEAQHAETASFLHALATREPRPWDFAPDPRPLDFVHVPGGIATIGYEGRGSLDNERPAHTVEIGAFEIARTPVTQAQFAAFMADGGYRRAELWTERDWSWLSHEAVDRPRHWRAEAPDHPVAGVSAHEADAFARWAGLRLPTEFEWERAARGLVSSAGCGNLGAALGATSAVGRFPGGRSADGAYDLLGNVWEWTSSIFAPYPGFQAWPYDGYSQTWFDGHHRVLRGGSWATRSFALRPSFRNWYLPETRQILAGFRCARNGPGR